MSFPTPEYMQYLFVLSQTAPAPAKFQFGYFPHVVPKSQPGKPPAYSAPPYSLGDGLSFMKKYVSQTAEPVACSTPKTSPIKRTWVTEERKVSHKVTFASMPELRSISPIGRKLNDCKERATRRKVAF